MSSCLWIAKTMVFPELYCSCDAVLDRMENETEGKKEAMDSGLESKEIPSLVKKILLVFVV